MLRETDLQPSLWEALLADEAKRLPAELAKIDAYLDDERFLAPGGRCLTVGWAARRCRSTRCCGCCTSSTATGWATRRCAGRWPTRSRGGGSAAGFIADHQLQQGNPPDAPQLVPAVERVIAVTGQAPGTVVGERGFGTAANDQAMETLGVKRSDCSAPAPGQGATGA